MAIIEAANVNTGALLLDPIPGGERRVAITAGAVLTFVYVVALGFLGGDMLLVLLVPAFAVVLLMQTNFELALWFLVICLFVDVHVSQFSSAVWLAVPFGAAFLLHVRDVRWRDFSNRLSVPIVLYGALILPSFLNATEPLMSLARLFNVAAFLIVLYAVIAGVRTHNMIRRVVAVFLAFALLNGIHALYEGITTGKRAFGFAGIMFVDYAGLAVTMSAAMSICARGVRRTFLLLLCLVLAGSLIMTQTRNSWISTVATLVLMSVYIVLHPEIVGIQRARLLKLMAAGLLVIGLGLSALLLFNPGVGRRATEIGEIEMAEGGRNSVVIKNSLVTRLLIWDTSLKAFLEHPIAGVGVYGFAAASAQYSRLPPALYRDYVAGASPHVAYFAVLTETGILGMIGFLVFLLAGMKSALRPLRSDLGEIGKKYALVGATGFTYCAVSMFATDAWLWGQGIVLLGLTMGLVIANAKIAGPDTAAHAS